MPNYGPKYLEPPPLPKSLAQRLPKKTKNIDQILEAFLQRRAALIQELETIQKVLAALNGKSTKRLRV